MLKIRKINFKTLITSILVMLIYFAWPYFVSSILNLFNFDNNLKITLMFFSNFLLLITIIFIYNESLKNEYRDFKKNYKKHMLNSFKIFLIVLILFILIHILISITFEFFYINDIKTFNFNKIFFNSPILLIILTFFYYPIIEELVFKKTLKGIINNKLIFVVLSGLLNACFIRIFIMENAFGFIYIIPESILLISYSYMYDKTGNIIVPIIYRMIYSMFPSILIILKMLEVI